MQCKSITSENYCKTKLYTSKTDFLYVKSNKMYSCVIVCTSKNRTLLYLRIFLLILGKYNAY